MVRHEQEAERAARLEQAAQAEQGARAAFISYLSDEITSASTAIMQFRNRISFTVFVGPFIVMGSLIISARNRKLDFAFDSLLEWVAIIVALVGFLALGILAGVIERNTWKNVHIWRNLVAIVQSGTHVTNEKATSGILDLGDKKTALWFYLFAFIIILLTFGATGYLAAEIMQFEQVQVLEK